MKYLYYPGCSLEGTAIEYHVSTQAVMAALGAELREIEDWTCCGASAAESVSGLLSRVLPARNLALAERMDSRGEIVIPCSACYLNLRRVEVEITQEEGLLDKLNAALGEEGLSYHGGTRSRHLLDVMANDLRAQAIADRIKQPLTGLRVAPYYGCQCLRPYGTYDDPQQPTCMEPLIAATGAEVHPWTMGAKCCGAGLMTTKKDVALELTAAVLGAARGADCIVTVCPMCQMNLDSYQGRVAKMQGEDLGISVLYLPQLVGLALGLSADEVRLKSNLALTDSLRQKLAV
jgi:heterodisulfide reductase subunit B